MIVESLYKETQVADPIKSSFDLIKVSSDPITELSRCICISSNKNGYWEIIGKEDEV